MSSNNPASEYPPEIIAGQLLYSEEQGRNLSERDYGASGIRYKHMKFLSWVRIHSKTTVKSKLWQESHSQLSAGHIRQA